MHAELRTVTTFQKHRHWRWSSQSPPQEWSWGRVLRGDSESRQVHYEVNSCSLKGADDATHCFRLQMFPQKGRGRMQQLPQIVSLR